MAKSKKAREGQPQSFEELEQFNLDFDFGGAEFDADELELDDWDFMQTEDGFESRYIRPRVYKRKASTLKARNAFKLADELQIERGERIDCIVDGSFEFADFISRYIVNCAVRKNYIKKLTISTLSMSEDNIISLAHILQMGLVDEMVLVISAYFYSHERHDKIPLIYNLLDREDKFQLAVASSHTKTAQFETYDGEKYIIHGSANLRSSSNIEQITIEENPEIYDFYDEAFTKIAEQYGTVNKELRGRELWRLISNKAKDNEERKFYQDPFGYYEMKEEKYREEAEAQAKAKEQKE